MLQITQALRTPVIIAWDYPSRQRAKCPGNSRSRAHHPLALQALRTPGLAPQVVSGKLFSEHRAYYFHPPICNYLEIKELENDPWK